MKCRGLPSALAVLALLAACTAALAEQREVAIWPGKSAPGSESWTRKEVAFTFPGSPLKLVRNVVRPTLTVYAPDRALANSTAVIVAPGGGMRFLSWENEGTAVAGWLAARGVTAFVLKYRLLETPADPAEFDQVMKVFFANLMQAAKARLREISDKITPSTDKQHRNEIVALAVADGREAVKYVRTHAAEWSIDPDRIGMMGFSAGAGVTMGVLLDHDAGSQINFAAPIYGGGTDGRPVPTDNPPIFLVVAQDDHLTFEGVEQLHRQLSAAGVRVELHSFAQGGHGFGMMKQGLPVDRWIDLYADWLDSLGLMRRGGTRTSEASKR